MFNPYSCIRFGLACRSITFSLSCQKISKCIFRLTLFLVGIIFGFSLYHRTTNMWALKNLGDSFLMKSVGRRPIVIGAFHRMKSEQNTAGDYAVMQFVGDTRQSHELYCFSEDANGGKFSSQAHIQRIHHGKRAANDICAWGGHLAECQIASVNVKSIRLSSNPKAEENEMVSVNLEEPLDFGGKKFDLVVCVGAMYIYTEWQILVTGMETWFALGASKVVFLIQSASNDTYLILKEYERSGKVLLRQWPKWPVLSDINPNGLVLSRGIEEAHVNCLHYVKPFADMVAFTDIDDMLLPNDPSKLSPTVNVEILKGLFNEHPNAGSLLFEHRDVQFSLPESNEVESTLANFNFGFLKNTQWKTKCKVWRMKTRVVVNASRVDTVNMHETGLHRLGYVQVRVPCRQAHFYHLRHSYKNIALNEWAINTTNWMSSLNEQWKLRLNNEFDPAVVHKSLVKSSVESFADFDKCMIAINDEHFTMKVSRCLTPHVCYSKLTRNVGCVASHGEYEFAHSRGDYVIVLKNANLKESDPNCEAPIPKYLSGNHYYLP
ncbi:glycosyltransferase family 92 domain-containing protein [Ditylenchus destructor]|nr:glycosyltransferase family 92 domain-containing protein [Ditylenchus destructor]